MKLTVVIPSRNPKLLRSCLTSIDNRLVDEIIVVNNGVKMERFPKPVKVINNKQNLGFAKAVNQGILVAQNDWVIVLNDDLHLDPDWLKTIGRTIEHNPGFAVYFGKVLDWEGQKIESTGLEFEIKGKSPLRRTDAPEGIVFGAPASAIVCHKPTLVKIGLFDEDFFAYLEDVDLSIRLNDHGFKTLYLPQIAAYHRGGATSTQLGNLRYRLTARNWFFIIIKHYSVATLIRHLPEIALEQIKNLLAVKYPSDILWVIKEVIFKCPKILKKRKPVGF